MKKNVGLLDQFIRFVIAFIAIMLYFADYLTGKAVLLLFAIFALTALLGYCPLYGILRVNTQKKSRKQNP